jgi:subtilisin family serine protease
MKVTITCDTGKNADKVFDMLIDPAKGRGLLKGKKLCVEEHEAIPDIMEFDLNEKEIESLKKIKGVVSVMRDDTNIELGYTKKGQTGIPKLASFTTNFNGNSAKDCIPHSLYYCQNYELSFTHQYPTSGALVSLSSIDCSNVDVIVLDSGVDSSHPDFKDQYNNSNVVNFDWTQLKYGDPITGSQITNTQSINYYKDTNGHGTSCASLIAGNKCGFAKNAKIYALRSNELGETTNGFDIMTCLDLALSFQKSKKLNLFGLLSSRPTVFSNSWGFIGPFIADDFDYTNINNVNFYTSLDRGKNTIDYNKLNGVSSTVDGYFRTYLNEGMHTLVSAGNGNIYLTNNPVSSINIHAFRKNDKDYSILRTQENNSSYVLNTVYNGYTYGSTYGSTLETRYLYTSPNIGLNYNKNTFPLIIVGDICPVGYNDTNGNVHWSAGNASSAFQILSATQTESRIVVNNSTRYESLSSPFFIKSAYSSFGPDVDIYAPGNGTWSAFSNQISTTTSPCITASANERYIFFNGTSAACPIVAGLLATYLSEFPNATTAEAKTWLLNNSVKGNIMETQMSTLPISSFNGTVSNNINIPFGANFNSLSNDPVYRLQRSSSYSSLYKNGNIDDILFCNRFFNSNNLIAQAYPLRKAVLTSTNSSVNINSTTLNKKEGTNQKITHNN